MTIETGIEDPGTYVDGLNDAYPAEGDDLLEGNNHIRGVKNAIVNTFPNITGAITATHTDINDLATKTGAETLTNKTLDAVALGTPASGNLANCTFPTLNQNTTGNAATATVFSNGRIGADYIKLSDVKTSGTQGGTFTSGSWQTRVLNTEDNDTGTLCALSANQFTLSAGTYKISAKAPAYFVNTHQARLYNVTDASVEMLGQNARSSNVTDDSVTHSFVDGEFTIASSKTLRLEHRCASTFATFGLGYAASFGSEVYSVVELWKVG